MFLEFQRIKIRLQFYRYTVVKHSLKFRSKILYGKWQLSMVSSTDVIVRNNPVKYEANFIIRLLLLSEMICA